jgi:tetratricopeptide (TPR) repeat protein
MGKIEEAIQICEKGLEYHPNFPGGRVALARCYLEKKWHLEAKRELEQVVKEVPENLLAHKLLADTHYALKDYASSLHSYKMAFLLSPNDIQIAEKIRSLEQGAPAKAAAAAEEQENIEIDEVVERNVQKPEFKPSTSVSIPYFQEEESELWSPNSEEKVGLEDLVGFSEEIQIEDSFKTESLRDIFAEDAQKKQKEITSETLADLYYSQGQVEKALVIYEKMKRQDPNSAISKKIMNCRLKLGLDKQALVREQQITTLSKLLKKVQHQT